MTAATTTPKAAPAAALPADVMYALEETRHMSEALTQLVRDGLAAGVLEYAHLQAALACLQRLDAAVEPVEERLQQTA